ncbi:hypothetical protein BY458DRAFT_553447 [Sporodiniella umbellata]|nr:hypothetical protein BY458DRAFT_553447 [Sporodiniella umbellata]
MEQHNQNHLSKREKLRSFANATTFAIKQELNKYYQNQAHSSRNINGVKRTDTQEIDEILNSTSADLIQSQCILFPTYASQENNQWKMQLAGWTFAKPTSGRLDRFLLAAGRTYGGFAKDSQEDHHFSSLLNQFRCQTLRMIDLSLHLPLIKEKLDDIFINSGETGKFEKEVCVEMGWIELIKSKCLEVEAKFHNSESRFTGFVDFIDPTGVSVISDIDDTIKVTDILDGRDAIIQNTFFRTAKDVPGMSEVYRDWAAQGAHIHYVSNSPWQVYTALNEFLSEKKFPQGSMHLRSVTTQELIMGRPGKHKLDIIPKILKDFPDRKFILVGDSGEIDPEIYQQIYHDFPDQIIKIFIHDVSSQRAIDADKLVFSTSTTDFSYYNAVRKFISRESMHLRRKDSSTQLAMDAMATTEVPQQEQQMSNPEIPLLTKLEQFEKRMGNIAETMPKGTFTVFSLASKLKLDDIVSNELSLHQKS